MIRINLLPVRQTRKIEALRREVALASVLGAAIIGGFVLIWAGLGIRLSAVNSDNARLDSEIAKLAEDVRRVDEMEKYKAELQRKLEVIATLRAKKAGPAHMLDELALAAPEKLQLKGITERGGAVTILGTAVSNEIISQFLRALEASEYFEQVYLQNIEASENAKTKGATSSIVVKEFSLTARLINPEIKAIEEASAAGKAGKGKPGKDAKAEGEAAGGDPPKGDAPTPAGAEGGEPKPAADAPAPAAGGTQ